MSISLFKKNIPYFPKNVKIDYNGMPGDSANELRKASDVIGNYAKAHNATVSFYDAKKIMGEFDSASLEKSLNNSVAIVVHKKGEKTAEGTWVKYAQDDNKPFLRRVYENLQWLTEKTDPRIINEKTNTKLNLIKKGIIKA